VLEPFAALALLVGPPPRLGPTIAWGDPAHAWAGGGGGILASGDGGASWRVQSRAPVRELVAADAEHAWALSRDETIRTTDGVHWRSLGAQGLLRLSFVNRSDGFAIERLYYFLRTRDGGLTWTPPGGPTGLQSICFSDARTGWVARGGTVWTTRDAGTHWSGRTLMSVRQGFPVPELFCRGDDVWAVLHDGAAAGSEGYTIFRSFDSGRTWRAAFASFSTTLPRVSNYSGPIAALGRGSAVLEGSCAPCGRGSVTFVRTPSGARTTVPGVAPGPIAFATHSLGLAVLDPLPPGLPTIFRTVDGGRTWKHVLASKRLRP
jgi:photosystem II stability/assembly factor-like uncharacterized protein